MIASMPLIREMLTLRRICHVFDVAIQISSIIVIPVISVFLYNNILPVHSLLPLHAHHVNVHVGKRGSLVSPLPLSSSSKLTTTATSLKASSVATVPEFYSEIVSPLAHIAAHYAASGLASASGCRTAPRGTPGPWSRHSAARAVVVVGSPSRPRATHAWQRGHHCCCHHSLG